jgi:hypothetical protein
MKSEINIVESGKIFNLDCRQDLNLIQDCQVIYEYFGNNPIVDEFDGFFAKIENGDYSEVYGFYGGIPRSYLDVYKISRTIK